MRKLVILLLMSIIVSCSSQQKLNKSIEKAKKQTMKDFKRGKIKVDYPILTP